MGGSNSGCMHEESERAGGLSFHCRLLRRPVTLLADTLPAANGKGDDGGCSASVQGEGRPCLQAVGATCDVVGRLHILVVATWRGGSNSGCMHEGRDVAGEVICVKKVHHTTRLGCLKHHAAPAPSLAPPHSFVPLLPLLHLCPHLHLTLACTSICYLHTPGYWKSPPHCVACLPPTSGSPNSCSISTYPAIESRHTPGFWKGPPRRVAWLPLTPHCS